MSRTPAAVLTAENPSVDAAAEYYLAVDKDEEGNEAECELAAVSGDKVVSFNHTAQSVDLSPETADIDWNYTLHEDTGVITLNYYTGAKTDVKVYSHYKVPGSDRVWKAELASYPIKNAFSYYMFAKKENIKTISFSDSLDTSTCTNMNSMFRSCSNLTSINFGTGFNTSNVTDMSNMFRECSFLTSLDVTGFDTSNVIDMGCMFSYCKSLTSLDVSGFSTSNAYNMNNMFGSCESLTHLDVTGFDTSSMEDMSGMFSDCLALTSLDVTGFDTSSVINMDSMFFGCESLANLDVTGFDTRNVMDMHNMFRYCSNMTEIKVTEGKWVTDQADTTNMFVDCGVSGVTYVTQTASAASAGLLPEAYAEEDAGAAATSDAIEIGDDDTSINYGIGDSIPYKLTATMPESITAYKKYKLVFHDKLSTGLDYNTVAADMAFESDIANYTGSTLPSTGGMGIYAFYLAGAAVVITVGTVMAARKKTKEE